MLPSLSVNPLGPWFLFDRVARKCKHCPFEHREVDFTRCLSFGVCTCITKSIFRSNFSLCAGKILGITNWLFATAHKQAAMSRYRQHLHTLLLALVGAHLRESKQTSLKVVNGYKNAHTNNRFSWVKTTCEIDYTVPCAGKKTRSQGVYGNYSRVTETVSGRASSCN